MLKTPRTTHHRRAQRGSHDRDLIYAILDAAHVGHVGLQTPEGPCVLPMAVARLGDRLILHGAPGSRLVQALAAGAPACVCVTHVDGLVLARSAFHHSLNYRSVMLFGAATPLGSRDDKRAALNALVEHAAPGRSIAARPTTDTELDGTTVLAFPIEEASAKVREGGPLDDPADLTYPVWAGVIPLRQVQGPPRPAPGVDPALEPPPFRVTEGSPEWAAEGVALAATAGWADTAEDWHELLAFGRVWAAHAPDGQGMVASGVLADFGEVGAVGKVLVRPEWRRQGLARRVMRACLDAAGPTREVWLLATPYGQPVYAALGFREVGVDYVLMGRLDPDTLGGHGRAATLADADWAEVVALDREAMGCGRHRMLEARRARSTNAVVLRDPRGALTAFAFAAQRGTLRTVGPVIARSPEAAATVTRAALGEWTGEVRVDVPSAQRAFASSLLRAGLTVRKTPVEMTLHGTLPGIRTLCFGRASAATG